MSAYEEAVLKARKKFANLNKTQEKELLKLYKELANQLSNEIASCRTTSQDAYLRKLNEIVQVNINQLNGKLNSMIGANIETSSQIAGTAESVYYQSITKDATLMAIFKSMPINNSRKVVSKLIQGNYYKDGKTLDQRLWNITQKNKNDINTLIKVNVLKGANARELAKQVDKYVNPTKVLKAHELEDGMSKKIAYQAQRLARTSITHAFSETKIENAKNNPFNRGIKWNLSASHYARMHGKTDVCDDYNGRVFKPDEVPLQHPNCLCYFTEENTDIDQALKELKAWTKGEKNPKLDKWYEANKDQGSEKQTNVVPIKKETKWSDAKSKDTQFKNKKEIKTHLGENYNIKFSDSTKYPIQKDILQDSVNWLDKFHNYFEGFKEIDPVELPAIKVKAGIKPVGYYQFYTKKPQALELVLNGEYFSNKEYNIKYIKECIDSKWTVSNAKGHKTFVHEYGHHIANSLKWLDEGSGIISTNWCKDFINDTIKEYNKKYSKNISFKDIAKLVSRYGGTKPEEAFAETFAEYFGGDNPREFAQVFGEQVEKKLKGYINKE